jgi:hypothetical protein
MKKFSYDLLGGFLFIGWLLTPAALLANTDNHEPIVKSARFSLYNPVFKDQKIFGFERWQAGFSKRPSKIFSGDLNADGYQDLIAYYNDSGDWYVALSTGDSFSPPALALDNFGARSKFPLTADFNGDKLTDILSQEKESYYVALADGTGKFKAPVLWKKAFAEQPNSLLVGDFNGDGKADLVSFRSRGAIWQVALSDGQSFSQESSWKSGFGNGSVEQYNGDFNGDGKDDLITFSKAGDWQVALSSDNQFIDKGVWQSKFGRYAKKRWVGDFDGDHKTDIATFDSAFMEVSRSDGTHFNYLGSWHHKLAMTDDDQVQIGDFNGDERDDLAIQSARTGVVRVGLSLPHPSSWSIELAKNDTESFYLLLYAELDDALDLVISSEGIAPGISINFKHVGFIDTNRTDSIPAVADPLLPDRYKPSFGLTQTRQELLLVEVKTSANAVAGSSSGFLTIQSSNHPGITQREALTIKIWDFQLPAKPTLATAYGLWWHDFEAIYRDDSKVRQAMQIWSEAP